ncbi:DMT family transporter [Solemya velum gill symbiont]|uniref:DMT family transporter n=1 Tax=Solemya velum gill symbiont TaxID=2340 RepID=UPI0009974A93|nr:DMT family transporter [Solemya velum gill symbiont]
MIESSTPHRNSPGTFWPVVNLLLSTTFWGILWWPLRLFESAGLNALWLTLVCYTAALLVSLPWLRQLSRIRTHWFLYLCLALAAGWGNLAFIIAMLEGTVMRVLLLFYMAPVWTLLFAHWILHEHISLRIAGVMLLAMCGVLLMLWNPQLEQPWPQGIADWLALSAGMAFALNNLMIRKLRYEPILLKTQVTWAGCILVAGFAVLIRTEALPQVDVEVIGWAILLGIFGFAMSNLTLQYGVTHMRAQRSAVILLFELVVGGVSAALIAGEILSFREVIGGAIIVIAGYLVTLSMADDEEKNEQT